jgi:hypothetical protein
MKRIILLLIGILILNVACQDDSIEPEIYIADTKSANYEKTKTYTVKAVVTAIPDNDGSQITCVPEESGVILAGSGWVSGHENILGKFDSENSTFEKESCEFDLTTGVPTVYTITHVTLQRMNGEQLFVKNYMWLNLLNGEISGYNDVIDGTGKFEGATGRTEMLNGKADPVTGIATWEEEGYLTLVRKS